MKINDQHLYVVRLFLSRFRWKFPVASPFRHGWSCKHYSVPKNTVAIRRSYTSCGRAKSNPPRFHSHQPTDGYLPNSSRDAVRCHENEIKLSHRRRKNVYEYQGSSFPASRWSLAAWLNGAGVEGEGGGKRSPCTYSGLLSRALKWDHMTIIEQPWPLSQATQKRLDLLCVQVVKTALTLA